MERTSKKPGGLVGEKINGLEAAMRKKEDTHSYIIEDKVRKQTSLKTHQATEALGDRQVSSGSRRWREVSEKIFVNVIY